MSKELVVCATRHETRVAVLEDDQLVEIYFQREKEYSLAGSIHKGRVTRVLPGMQSAFVDIGLDRDAFLYVSDFFEDNEEYDKIVTSVEEKVLRMEKGTAVPALEPAAAPPEASAPSSSSPTTEPDAPMPEALPAAPAASPQVANGQAAPAPSAEGHDNRDRQGRRPRRRRPRGRGLPESKFYSARTHPEPQPAQAAASEDNEGEFPVLPGESLAKYGIRRSESRGGGAGQEHSSESSEDEGQARATTGPGESDDHGEPESRHETLASREPAGAGWDRPERREEEPRESENFGTEITGRSTHPSPLSSSASFTADESAEPDVPRSWETKADAEPGPKAGFRDEEDQDQQGGTAVSSASDTTSTNESGSGTSVAAGDEGASAQSSVEDPSVDPARTPSSLTATLREQGPRYLHRMSRRMRRKMRGGSGPAPEAHTAPPVREARAPEPRSEPKVEGARRERTGPPSISDLLREGQEIIVQIAKEPLGQKGARITSHIALPGRFLVYMPTVDHIGVSRKIPSDDERLRLKRILQQHRAGIPGGYIVRTAGEGRSEEELHADMMFLYNMWMDLRQKAEKRSAPALVHHDLDVVQRIMRDQLTSAFKTIWVDSEEIYENVLSFVQRFQPALVGRVKLYTRTTPIFEEFGVTQEIEQALRPKVWLKSGGYIVINQTEALVAVDVNTGKYVGKSNRLEDTIVKTNTDAIKEIVRQIRLRDLGGIIVVDFIDMDERKNRQKVMQALEDAMRSDRAPYKILQFNDFGLVAITRKRVKQSLERALCAPCPYCEAAGYVKSVQTVIGEILEEAQKMAGVLDKGDVTLRVNPEIAKVLKSNKTDHLQELEEVLGRNVMVKSDPMMHQEKFDLA